MQNKKLSCRRVTVAPPYHLKIFSILLPRKVAKRGIIAMISCQSVRLSVTLVDCDHTRWNSLKIIHSF